MMNLSSVRSKERSRTAPRMAPVEGVGDAEDGRELEHDNACFARKRNVVDVRGERRGLAVIARHIGDDVDVLPVEAEDFRVGDDVFAVPVVSARPQEGPDVVENRGDFEEHPLVLSEAVLFFERIEQLEAQVFDMGGVRLVVAEALCKRARGRDDLTRSSSSIF